MQARRALSLSAFALTSASLFAAVLGACGGGDNTVTYECAPGYICILADAATDAKKDSTPIVGGDDDDAGQTTCSPQQVPAWSFKAPGKYLGKCTDDALGQLYDACISDNNTIAGCDAAKAQLADCSACAFGGATDPVEHPWLVYDDRVTAFPNFGLCMATIRDESSATECGVAYGQFYTCLNAACVTPCASLQNATAFDDCRQNAYNSGVCKAGGTTALSTKCTTAYKETDPTYGFCTSVKDPDGKALDDRGFMLAIAKLTCGSDPSPKDGGSDADAGDAGDADADAKGP